MLINSKIIELTIESEGWEGESVPYSYDIPDMGCSTNDIIDIIPTIDNKDIYNQLVDSSITADIDSDTNTLFLYSWGQKPTKNFKVTVVKRGAF